MKEKFVSSFCGKKVVVLGGSGFIGTNLTHSLLRLGANVTRFGRTNRYSEGLTDVNWSTGSFSDAASVARAVVGHEVVFHLISESVPGSSNVDVAGDLISSVENTLKLLNICRESKVENIIFASSGGTVYGKTGEQAAREYSDTSPLSAYGVSKLTVEKYLALYRHLHGINYRIVRISNPFGRFQRSHRQQGLVAAILERSLRDQPIEIWGDGSVTRDYIAVNDLIDGIIAVALYEGEQRIFNIGSGIGRSIDDVVDSIELVLERKILRQYRLGRLSDVPYNVLDVSLIKKELGWSPSRDWLKSLKETVIWLKEDLLLSGSG